MPARNCRNSLSFIVQLYQCFPGMDLTSILLRLRMPHNSSSMFRRNWFKIASLYALPRARHVAFRSSILCKGLRCGLSEAAAQHQVQAAVATCCRNAVKYRHLNYERLAQLAGGGRK